MSWSSLSVSDKSTFCLSRTSLLVSIIAVSVVSVVPSEYVLVIFPLLVVVFVTVLPPLIRFSTKSALFFTSSLAAVVVTTGHVPVVVVVELPSVFFTIFCAVPIDGAFPTSHPF